MATLLRTDRPAEDVAPDDAKAGFQLAQLYRLLECSTIEIIRLGDGFIMVIDEEGKLKEGNTVNGQATYFARDVAGAIMANDCIVGHALVCLDAEVK